MYMGITEIYHYHQAYCAFVVARDDCKWFEFFKKKAFQEQIDYYYPLMRNESKQFIKLQSFK